MNTCKLQLIKAQEEDAKLAISNFIKADINGRIHYKQQKRTFQAQEIRKSHFEILETYSEFWNTCISSFQEYISGLDDAQFIAQLDGQKINIDTLISDPASQTFETCIDDFMESYKEVETQFLIGSGHEKRCAELFRELCNEIGCAQKFWDKAERKKIKTKDFYIELIEKSLNLDDKNVCELLPYLITAYIFNCQQSHLFYQQNLLAYEDNNMQRFFQLFSEDDIDAINAPKIREMASSASDLFTLAKCKEKGFIKPEHSCNDEDRQSIRDLFSLYLYQPNMSKGPSYIKYQSLLNSFFFTWCKIIRSASEEFDELGLKNMIDYQKSLDLYNHYTDQNLPMLF